MRPFDSKVGLQLLGGRFKVTELIAQGGMGAVYKATNRELGNEVAIKFLRTDRLNLEKEDLKRRFLIEMETLARLKDVRIPRVLAKGEAPDGSLFMVTELLHGQTLHQELRSTGRIAPARVVRLLEEVCLALSEAHASGIIHRDIKPANLFVQEIPGGLDQVRVLDFGIAKVTREGFDLTSISPSGRTPWMGTFNYMSPEQARAIPVVPQSDLYSLGVVAYHCLTGQPPFTGEAFALVEAHKSSKPRTFKEVAPDLRVDRQLEQLVFSLLAKDPKDRPQTAQAVYEAFRQIQSSMEGGPGRRRAGGRTATGIVVGAAMFGLAVAVAVGAQLALTPTRLTEDSQPAAVDRNAGPALSKKDAGPAGSEKSLVRILTRPSSAKVLVDGDPLDAPKDGIQLAPGDHVAVVSAPGFNNETRRFQVESGQGQTIDVELTRRPTKPTPKPKPKEAPRRPAAQVLSYRSVRIQGNAQNRKAKRIVSAAAVACFAEAYSAQGKSIQFTMTAFPDAAPEVGGADTAFSRCMSKRLREVRYDVVHDGLVVIEVGPNSSG